MTALAAASASEYAALNTRLRAEAEVRLGRSLSTGERVIDLAGNDATLETAKADLAEAIEKAKRRAIRDFVAGRPWGIRVTKEMVTILERLYQAGRAAATQEVATLTGSRSMADSPFVDPKIGDHIKKLDKHLNKMEIRITKEGGVTQNLGDFSATQVAAALEKRVPGAMDAASQLVSGTFSSGLADVFSAEAGLFSGWQYSAVMDGNTCETCDGLDGEEYESWEAIQEVLPDGGPNPDCDGGDRCRCRPVPMAVDGGGSDGAVIGSGDAVAGEEAGANVELLTSPDSAAKAFMDGVRESQARLGRDVVEKDIAQGEKAWLARLEEGLLPPDAAIEAKVSQAAVFNSASPLYRDAVQKFGTERVAVIRTGVTDPLLHAQERFAASRLTGNRITLFSERGIRDFSASMSDRILPGIGSTGRSVADTLRHEYGHQIWSEMSLAERDAFRALLPDSATIGEQLTLYARENTEEAFCELFSVASSPLYSASDWASWVEDGRRLIMKDLSPVTEPVLTDAGKLAVEGDAPNVNLTGDWSVNREREASVQQVAQELANKYATDFKTVQLRPVEEFGQLAGKSKESIYLSPRFADDKFMAKHLEAWKNVSTQRTPEDILVHEFGHILDGELLARFPDAYAELDRFLHEKIPFGDKGRLVERLNLGLEAPSAYGTENRYEFVAEAFADWYKNGEAAHPSSIFVGKLLDKNLLRAAEPIPADLSVPPQFQSLPEASSWAVQNLAGAVDFGTIDLPGVQAMIDGAASVLTPYGVRLERMTVIKSQGRALAKYGYYNRTKPGYIEAQRVIADSRKITLRMQKERANFLSAQARDVAWWEKKLADVRPVTSNKAAEDSIRAYNLKKLEEATAPQRWIAAEDAERATETLIAHEAAHALYTQRQLGTEWLVSLKKYNVTTVDRLRVSQYGASETGELFSESMAMFVTGRERELPTSIANALRDTLATLRALG